MRLDDDVVGKQAALANLACGVLDEMRAAARERATFLELRDKTPSLLTAIKPSSTSNKSPAFNQSSVAPPQHPV